MGTLCWVTVYTQSCPMKRAYAHASTVGARATWPSSAVALRIVACVVAVIRAGIALMAPPQLQVSVGGLLPHLPNE